MSEPPTCAGGRAVNWPDDYVGKVICGDCRDALREVANA